MKNLSFEDGWETLPPTGNAGWLQNQRPNYWELTILPPGAELWDSTDQASGEPECVHKLINQLPPNEQPGGSDPLILDGTAVYKIFHSGAAFGVQLRQVVEGLKPGSQATAIVRIRVHDHQGTDPYGVEFRMMTNGQGGWWRKTGGQLLNFAWAKRQQTRTIGGDGRFELVIQVKSKYKLPVDFFLDNFEFSGEFATDPEPPPPDPDPDPDPEPPPCDCSELEKRVEILEAQYLNLNERLEALEGTPGQPPGLALLTPRALAVDVSAHQGAFNWEKAKSGGVKYAVLRSSNGLGSATTDENGRDVQLYRNAAECIRLGIPFAIYHFMQPGKTTEQIDLVLDIIDDLAGRGTLPRMALLEDGAILPSVWIDVEMLTLSQASVRLMVEALEAGIYSSKSIWEALTAGVDVWWSETPAWMAQWGNNSGQIPPETAVPLIPKGFDKVSLWQFASQGGALIGWPGGLDVNLTGPFTAVSPPPTGKIYPVDFLRADPQAWRVIRRADGSGEDVWDLPLGGERFVRVKNSKEGEWYNGRFRERDTSPAPDSTGKARLYLQTTNGVPGGEIAPTAAEVGKVYTFYSDVQYYAKSNCTKLDENSGLNAPSTFQLVEVVDNYTFPGTGFTVDRLYKTLQTGEWQLYADHDGRHIGWVGGGAVLPNNQWSGELQELYFNRQIPQLEPNKYCA